MPELAPFRLWHWFWPARGDDEMMTQAQAQAPPDRFEEGINDISEGRQQTGERVPTIVFVHDVTQKPEDTWTIDSEPPQFWPDLLKKEVDMNARVTIFKYDVTNDMRQLSDFVSARKLTNHAKDLLRDIPLRTADGRGERPVIFVAHGYGGLICEKAITLALDDGDTDRGKHLARGIILFNTPLSRAGLAQWAVLSAEKMQIRYPKSATERKSHVWPGVEADLDAITEMQKSFRDFITMRVPHQPRGAICCYGKQRIAESGLTLSPEWAMVPRVRVIGINADHHHMTKFDSPSDKNFESIKKSLSTWVRDLTENAIALPAGSASTRSDHLGAFEASDKGFPQFSWLSWPNDPGWKRGPSSSRLPSSQALYDKMRELMVGQDPLTQFLPASDLQKLLGPNAVRDALKSLDCSDEEKKQLVDFIASRAPRVFATLVWRGQEPLIRRFYEFGFDDTMLPSKGVYDCFAELDPRSVGNFYHYQWLFLAPSFRKDRFRYVLHPQCPMPFLDRRQRSKLGFSSMEECVIHRAHLCTDIETPLTSESHPRLTLKQLTKEMAEKEAVILEIMNKDPHPHFIQAIAYCTQGNKDFILFPWADGGDLRRLWQFSSPILHSAQYLHWVFSQLAGLAGAVCSLHDKNIRYCDLRPENILVFGTTASEDTWSPQRLVIAGAGREANTIITVASEYSAPEMRFEIESSGTKLCDVWSMGCVFLEFVIWLLYHEEGLHDFWEGIKGPWPMGGFCISDDPESGQARIHPTVVKYVEEIKIHPSCHDGTALGRLVSLITARLLVVALPGSKDKSESDHGQATRASAREMHETLKAITELGNDVDIVLLPMADEDLDAEFRTKPPKRVEAKVAAYQADYGDRLIARATVVGIVHGTLTPGGDPGTLLVFEFRFISMEKARRFTGCNITITFEDSDKQGHLCPEVRKVSPEGSFALHKSSRQRSAKISNNSGLSTGVSALGASLGTVWEIDTAKNKKEWTRLSGTRKELGRNDRDDAVLWAIHENSLEKSGIPNFLRTAVLLRREAKEPFNFLIKIRAQVDMGGLGDLRTLFGKQKVEQVSAVKINPSVDLNTLKAATVDPKVVDLTSMDEWDLDSLADVALITLL